VGVEILSNVDFFDEKYAFFKTKSDWPILKIIVSQR